MKVHTFEDASQYFSCSCQSFSTAIGWCGESSLETNCCHIRFLKDVVNPNSGNVYVNTEKLKQQKEFSGQPVVQLPSKSGIIRFSVVGEDKTCSFVTIYENYGRRMIQCHSTECQISFGKARKLNTIDSDNICCHLKTIKDVIDFDHDDSDDDNEIMGFQEFAIPDEEVSVKVSFIFLYFEENI